MSVIKCCGARWDSRIKNCPACGNELRELKSSVLTCYEGDNHCSCCRFIDGERDKPTMMDVILTLDKKLAESELSERRLMKSLVNVKKNDG